ncbi:MAG TPA: MarR family winged helix-turn-helix transcriptional regulator [Nocardioidaceae bacterium]|nr:MarR family winged helix-turn-helix transcriptional regulator [Nocardioidaceae bacterium]
MKLVNDDYPDHIFAILDRALRTLRDDIQERVVDHDTRGLRTSQLRVVSLTPADGLRVTELAERVGMTAQALGEFVRGLTAAGLLEVVPDPSDGRARIVRPTAAGQEAAEQWRRDIAAMEEHWRQRLGPRRWEAMRRVLLDVIEAQ